MHASYFSYKVSRPYPFKWFTPAVVVGGLFALVLISFVGIATQGYEMTTVYSFNPNSTDGVPNFFAGWPSFLTANIKSTCSPTTIPLGTKFYTNNTALKYTVSNIWKLDSKDAQPTLVGSFPYQNNFLQQCSVTAIAIDFQGIERNAIQIANQQWGGVLNAWVTCGIETPDGWFDVNLTTTYEANPRDRYGVNYAFVGRNKTSKASLWWGESLLAWYSIAVTNDIHIANEKFTTDNTPAIYKGTAHFLRSTSDASSAEGIKSLEFFNAGCFFVPFSDNGVEKPIYYCHRDGLGNFDLISNLVHANESDPNTPLPGIWISADSLAKSFYFTMLADLGQDSSGPNILVDPDLLSYFSDNFTAINTREPTWGDNMSIRNFIGLATVPFRNLDASKSNLEIRPSVIRTTYLCQVPKKKKIPTLVVSVLINDIVLLSSIWKIFQLIIDYFLGRKYSDLRFCEGCLKGMSGQDDEDASIAHENCSSR